MDNRKNTIAFISSLIWVVFIVIGYYYFHKPISLSLLKPVGVAVLNFLIAGGITLLAGGVGRQVFSNQFIKRTELTIVQAALGFGILSFAWLLIGLIVGYSKWIAWAVLIAGIIIFRKAIVSWLKEFFSIMRGLKTSNGFERFILVILFLILGIQLIISLAPPLAWDALMYHLEIPRRYLSQGRFFFVSDNFYWGQPQLAEILFSWCGALFKWETATTLCWYMVTLFIVGVFEFVKKTSQTGAWVAVASLLAGETFRTSLSSGYVDGISALFGYALWVVLLVFLEEQNKSMLNWAGVLLGMALWVKISNGLLIPIIFLSILVINLWCEMPWWKGIRAVVIGGFVFSFWLLLLWGFTGNPFYPHFIDTPWVSQARYSFFKPGGINPGLTALWLPVAMTWYGLHKVFVEGKLIFAADIGPLLVSFGLIGLIAKLKEKAVKLALIWIAGGLLFMVGIGLYSGIFWQVRLYYVILTPVLYLVGKGWDVVSQIKFSEIRLWSVLSALIILVCFLFTAKDIESVVRMDSIGAVLGTTTQEEYLDENLGWFHQAVLRIKELPRSAKVLMLWEPRGFYLPENVYPDVWIDRWYMTVNEFETKEDILESWRRSGFTHILINLYGMEYERNTRPEYQDGDWIIYDELLQAFPLPVDLGHTYALYQIP